MHTLTRVVDKYTYDSIEFDLSEYGVDAIDKALESFRQAMLEGAAEVLRDMLVDDDTFAYFPIECNDVFEGDPLTIYIRFSNSAGTERFSFTLRDVLAQGIEDCKADGSYSENLQILSHALKTLAAELDAAVQEGEGKYNND